MTAAAFGDGDQRVGAPPGFVPRPAAEAIVPAEYADCVLRLDDPQALLPLTLARLIPDVPVGIQDLDDPYPRSRSDRG